MNNWINIKDEQPRVGSYICIKWGENGKRTFANCYVLSLLMHNNELNLKTRVGTETFLIVNALWQPYIEGMTITV